MTQRGWSGITVTDQFCGAGGSTIGAKRAGLEVRLAQNHWARAVETYSANHQNTIVALADVSASDPRKYPSTDILITSPECTTHSPAGGTRRSQPSRDLVPHAEDPEVVRSRATMWDVVRYAEFHQYRLIIVENVVEAYSRWHLFGTWLTAMHVLGYEHQIVSMNSMFCHPTPQSRDRIYIVFWRKGNRRPDLEMRPQAPCSKCERVVEAVQTWKNGRTVGKYKTQYIFTCSICRTVVTPFYYAALNAIDFSLQAERIGDRARPLKDRTLERIRYGLERYGNRELVISTLYGERLASRVREGMDPMFTMQGSSTTALLAPFIVRSQHSTGGPHARPLDSPMGTATATGSPALASPFLANISRALDASKLRGLNEAMMSQTTQQEVGFVFNVGGRDSMAPLSDRPMPTQETREKFAVALVSQAFMVTLRTHNKGSSLADPMATMCAGTIHHAMIQGAAQLSMRDANAMRVAGLDRELMTQGGAPQQAILSKAPFLQSYYGGSNVVAGIEEPVNTVNCRERHAMVTPAVDVDDCYFRMLQPHEIGAAMAFDRDYIVTGNKREQVKQFGNAVTPPAMDWLVSRAAATLAPEIAA